MSGIPKGFHRSKLGDEIRLQRGYDLPERQRVPGDVPIVTSSGITGTHNVAMAKGPGVVTGRYGTLGEVYYIQEDYWPHNTALFVSDFKGNEPRFVAYFLKTLQLGTQNAAGAVPGVNRNVLHAMEVLFPEPELQRRIAAILAAYDDLIENNRRRMALLEDALHRLYRQWFVHLRFPGHAQTPLVDGVPEGWCKRRLEEVGFFNYGKSLKEDVREPGDVPVYGSSGIVGTHGEALIEGPAIIIGRKGNVGSVYWSSRPCYPIDTVFYVNGEQSSLYLFYCLQYQHFINSDSAVPGLNRAYAHSLPILWPEDAVRLDFETKAQAVHKQIDTLTAYNERLREARDLLLPRLMNGSIPL